MYTILVNETNELVTSVRERIMQHSKLVDNLHFLVDQTYKGIPMADFTVTMEYVLPISRKYCTETLVKSESLYKDRLEYMLPMDTKLTKEAGDIEVQLTFTKLTLNSDGSNVQQVRKTDSTIVTILPITAWSNIIPDEALTALDQRILMTQAMLEAANDMTNYLDEAKADNITYDKSECTLQLMSNGVSIGDKVSIKNIMEDGVPIINISDDNAPSIDTDIEEDNVVEF